MYHITNKKHWFSHLHIPAFMHKHAVEKIISDKRLWTALAITLFIAFLIILTFWAATLESTGDTHTPYYPYMFPITPN
ncbi:MAG: hypothetical protein JXD22_14755 [Sedimentisphaerales bacterium]|nr:hypothetical protein [Sedimentisphaerales bacterium]